MQKEVKLYLVRHGQTLFNLLERVQGWCDSPLTNDGIEIAKLCGLGLSNIEFVKGCSSDLLRAKKTLDIILEQNKNNKPNTIEEKDLRELCFGDFEGAFDFERKEACSKILLGELNMPLLNEKLKNKEITPREMMNATASIDKSGFAESYDFVEKRSKEIILKIADETFKQGGGNVLIVSHGVTISAILNSFPGEKLNFVKDMKNASVSILSYIGNNINIDKAVSMEFVEKGKKILNNQ